MGSDFIISVIEVKKTDTADAYRKRIINGLDELIEEWVKENLENYDLSGFDTSKPVIPQLIDSINETFESFDGRDCAWFDNETSTFYIAGGNTWGDDPSDTYTLFETFNKIVAMMEDE